MEIFLLILVLVALFGSGCLGALARGTIGFLIFLVIVVIIVVLLLQSEVKDPGERPNSPQPLPQSR